MQPLVTFHPEACREPKEAHVIEHISRIRTERQKRAGIHASGDSPDLPIGIVYPYRAKVLSADGKTYSDLPAATDEDRKWDQTVGPLNDAHDFAVAMNEKSRVMNRKRNDSRIHEHLDLLLNPQCHLGAHLDPLEAHVILKDSIDLAAEMARMFVEDRKRKTEDRKALVSALSAQFNEPETYAEFQLLVLDLLKTYPQDVVLEAISQNVASKDLPAPPAPKAAPVAPVAITTPPPPPSAPAP